MSQQLKLVVSELKKEKGFTRLFSSFHEKYRSYERIENNITVKLVNPTVEEKDAIGGLFGVDYTKSKSISITASKFEKALKKTKYGPYINEIPFEKIVEDYFGGQIVSKREEKERFLSERSLFFSQYKQSNRPEKLVKIISWIEQEDNSNNRYFLQYKQDKISFKRNLDIMCDLLKEFPLKEPIFLPIFAAKITKNPHAFDIDKDKGGFLIYTLQILKEIESGEKIKRKLTAEETAELLLEYNILRDELTNDVTVFNVGGRNKDGEVNMLLEGAINEKAAVNLPLREVIRLESVATSENTLYMVENSAVASFLINEAMDTNKSIVCGNGILNLATLKFLDMFINMGGTLFYSGDFDPEGLGIAQRLINRYGNAVYLWNYDVDNYIESISDNKIEDFRLKQLSNNINDAVLMEVAKEMSLRKKAGYQENILGKFSIYS